MCSAPLLAQRSIDGTANVVHLIIATACLAILACFVRGARLGVGATSPGLASSSGSQRRRWSR
jgi:hypothetical protein